jgi:hypothetical protein
MVLLSEESSDVEPLVAPVRKQPDVPGSANPSPSRMSSDKRLSGGMSSGNIRVGPYNEGDKLISINSKRNSSCVRTHKILSTNIFRRFNSTTLIKSL